MVRYRSKRPDDAPLRERMVELAHERRRFGYRRLHVMLKSEGLVVNRKKTQRIDREDGLKVRRRGGRRRAIGTRAPIPDVSLSGRRVVRELDRIIARRGPPEMIVSDNGTELTSHAVLAWTQVSIDVASTRWPDKSISGRTGLLSGQGAAPGNRHHLSSISADRLQNAYNVSLVLHSTVVMNVGSTRI